MTNTQYLRKRLTEQLNLSPVGDKTESLESLRATEWCPEFEQLMRNRLLVGRFRYGRMGDENKGDYDHVGSIVQRLRLYQKTRNLEHLVDVANLALVEFRHSKHPNKHFSADDDVIHCEAINR